MQAAVTPKLLELCFVKDVCAGVRTAASRALSDLAFNKVHIKALLEDAKCMSILVDVVGDTNSSCKKLALAVFVLAQVAGEQQPLDQAGVVPALLGLVEKFPDQ